MRGVRLVVLIGIAGCGSSGGGDIDAPAADAAIDGAPDASCMTTLLAGGTDVGAQGWSLVEQQPAVETYGADHVQLATTTNPGATTSGQALLARAGAFQPGAAFRLEVVFELRAVNRHNPFDAAAAIMGSFTPPVGAGNDRNEMIYLDDDAIGWADDTQAFAATLIDGTYHTLVLAVDAGGAAAVTLDGAPALTRAGYTTNGGIAIGDQTNDANVDGTIRFRSVTLLCP